MAILFQISIWFLEAFPYFYFDENLILFRYLYAHIFDLIGLTFVVVQSVDIGI